MHGEHDAALAGIHGELQSIRLLLTQQNQLIERGFKFMADQLARLQTEVSETTTVIDSAIALLQGLSAKIEALKNDPAKLQALADELDAKQAQLSAAIVANTPAAPTPE